MQALYSVLARNSTPAANNMLEDIRQVMQDEVEIRGGSSNTILNMRISEARDLQDLWYLRGDLMAAIAEAEGEASARRKLNQISNLFRGALPKGMSSRPSPLGD
jgi:hypothetical protein